MQWPGARWVIRSRTKRIRPVPIEAVVLNKVSAPMVIVLPSAFSVLPSVIEHESENKSESHWHWSGSDGSYDSRGWNWMP